MTKLTDTGIKKTYNAIAEGFYNLRQQPITLELKKISEKWLPGKLLDVGCGIGNSTLPFIQKKFSCVGVDIASKQIVSAKKFSEKNRMDIKLAVASSQHLPFTKGVFDYIISAATIHHLDSEKKRIGAISEMKRVLNGKGKIFLTVWNKETKKKDDYVTWTSKNIKYKRYYHFFNKKELEDVLERSGFRKVRVFNDGKNKNICAEAVK